jgi:hypothetical protein
MHERRANSASAPSATRSNHIFASSDARRLSAQCLRQVECRTDVPGLSGDMPPALGLHWVAILDEDPYVERGGRCYLWILGLGRLAEPAFGLGDLLLPEARLPQVERSP